MRSLIGLALSGAFLVACSQQPGAVRGFESQGGWQKFSETRATDEHSSDVQYLGASADGKVIVRMPNGTVQIWGRQ